MVKKLFNIISQEIQWGSSKLRLESGRIARQADAAVMAHCGDTVVLCTVVSCESGGEDVDFLALTVNYQEKLYAAGKIPGGFFKRETKPSEKETLVSRLVDRSLRPLFPDEYRGRIQIICTVLSYDGENSPDVLSIIGASAALMLTGLPFAGPIAAARVGHAQNGLILNPKQEMLDSSTLDLVVAGTRNALLMVESEAQELSLDLMMEALSYAHEQINPVLNLIEEFTKKHNIENKGREYSSKVESLAALRKEIYVWLRSSKYYAEIAAAFKEDVKKNRQSKLATTRELILQELCDNNKNYTTFVINLALEQLKSDILRGEILHNKIRIGGRAADKIRDINCMVDYLPRLHGSALFTRGETQVLVATTIGTSYDEQMSEGLSGVKSENFILHYNFPPYAVGEAGMLRAPGRREIGHGRLALKAIKAVLPAKNDFPYTMRVVSDVTESNGSSSMATVCGTSLSLMASGIPIRRHVAGIAMGLIKEGDKFAVLSDINGDEDHLGDMDFKVAGTANGITALQMDMKIEGISKEIMGQALMQAQSGLQSILQIMQSTIDVPRSQLNPSAPRIVTIEVGKDKIREIIGQSGKVIRDICEKSGARIEIEDSGKVVIAAANQKGVDTAIDMISKITEIPEVGKIYEGQVSKVVSFGLFVKVLRNCEGLVHVSEISGKRIENVFNIYKEGDKVTVKVLGVDRNGKIKLSIKGINGENTGDASPIPADSAVFTISQKKKNMKNEPNGEPSENSGNETSSNNAKKLRFF
ncbi:polynucleotide phosphorylase [Alphaproteobacteria bacterium]